MRRCETVQKGLYRPSALRGDAHCCCQVDVPTIIVSTPSSVVKLIS